MTNERKKLSIAQIEALLEKEDEVEIEILPNGEVRRVGGGALEDLNLKPITMRENLGGEYGIEMRAAA
jgi:phage I-like protein